jgi:N-acyl-D-aspartate/D-glutamate deacylase
MAEFDTVLKGGMVVDGTRSQRYRADVAITDGRIARIGRINATDARSVLDASGLVVAPGFVDLHTHYDAQLFWDPYLSLSGWHGVTSVVIGNCGFGFAPVHPEARDRAMLTMTRVEAIPYASMQAGLPWDWITYPEFLDSVDRAPKAVNVRPFFPIAPMLVWVMGLERAKAGELPTDAEHAEMRRLLHEAMDAGAGGWSAQRLEPASGASVQRDYDGTPMTTDVMHDETCFVLAEVLAERNDGFVQMTCARADGPSHAFYERLADISGRPILYNVVTVFDNDPAVHRKTLAWLKSCRERGLRVYGQAVTTDAGFSFTFEDWNLFDEADAWAEATTGTLEERLAKLSDPARRPGLRDARVFITTNSLADIVVLGPRTDETKRWANHTVGDVAAATGKHVVDAMLDIAVADRLKTAFYTNPPNVSLEYLQELLDYEWAIPGVSDGGAHTKFLTAGRYPTELLAKAVRDHEMLSLEAAHWRLSALPAHCAGFTGRGTLVEGAAADIVAYDFENLSMTPVEVVHDLPGGEWRRVQRGLGYRYVLVNGEVTIEDDKETGAASGRLLRHARA